MGIAMSITAFPVLARIVQERGIHKTRLGTIVITAAADDITAWCILAAVIAIVKAGSFVSSLYTIGLALTYVGLMMYVVKPFLKRIGDLYSTKSKLSKPVVPSFSHVDFLLIRYRSHRDPCIVRGFHDRRYYARSGQVPRYFYREGRRYFGHPAAAIVLCIYWLADTNRLAQRPLFMEGHRAHYPGSRSGEVPRERARCTICRPELAG
jgi:hypothetical protein